MEPAGSGATWTGSPKGGFSGRKHHKPRQSVVANTLNGACGEQSDIDGKAEGRVSGSERVNLFRNGASLLAKTFGVGFIDWLDVQRSNLTGCSPPS